MGGGSISPFEWIFPVVGATHAAYNAASQQVSGNRAKLVTPGSSTDRQNKADDRNEQALGEQRAAAARAADDLRYNTTPQTPQEEWAARRRAQSAKQALGSGRASQQLTGTLG